eukprot:COSAG01_NODE_1527_length_10015_cov_79.013312_1_plen_60_part_10
MWGVTLVHCCVFAACAGQSVRSGSYGRRLRVAHARKNREKCCPNRVGVGNVVGDEMDVGE